VNALDANDWSPLHVACYAGHTLVARRLLAAGADTSALESETNKTALHLAAGKGQTDCVLELLSGGGGPGRGGRRAEVNAVNHAGITPAHDAAAGGHAGALHLLLAAGADPDGMPPLNAELTLATKSFSAALRFTCGPLLGLGSGIVGGGGGGGKEDDEAPRGPVALSTPLHLAVRSASIDCASLLLAAGCAADAADARGESALHHAARAGDAELLELLLHGGAGIEARSRSGATPLRVAARAGHVAACMVLLGGGADPYRAGLPGLNLPNPEVSELLQLCLEEESGPPAAVRLMLVQKAAVDGELDETAAASLAARVPAAVAAATALRGIMAQLRRGALHSEEAHAAAEAAVASLGAEDAEAAAAAFPLAFPLRGARGTGGRLGVSWRDVAALHSAATSGDADRLVSLLGSGADPNARDASGATPLHAAAAAGCARAVRVLLAGGADWRLRREAGGAEAAASRDGALHAHLLFGRIAQLVASAGAERGKTALELAVGEAREVLSALWERERAREEREAGAREAAARAAAAAEGAASAAAAARAAEAAAAAEHAARGAKARADAAAGLHAASVTGGARWDRGAGGAGMRKAVTAPSPLPPPPPAPPAPPAPLSPPAPHGVEASPPPPPSARPRARPLPSIIPGDAIGPPTVPPPKPRAPPIAELLQSRAMDADEVYAQRSAAREEWEAARAAEAARAPRTRASLAGSVLHPRAAAAAAAAAAPSSDAAAAAALLEPSIDALPPRRIRTAW